jgi:hypothetical protein
MVLYCALLVLSAWRFHVEPKAKQVSELIEKLRSDNSWPAGLSGT